METDTPAESDESRSPSVSPIKSPNRTEEAHSEGLRTASSESNWSGVVAHGRKWTRNDFMLNLNRPITSKRWKVHGPVN